MLKSRGVALEVVVVDDGGTDDYCGLPQMNEARVSLAKTSGAVGAGAARNLGAAGFEGHTLIFVDADVEVEPEALACLIEPILEARADACVGRYSDQVHGMGFAEAYKQLYLAHIYGRRVDELTNTFWTAIGAVRAQTFFATGGFSEGFEGAGPEDVDLGMKLTAAGFTIVAVPEAAGRHLRRLSVLELAANDLRKGCEDIYLHWKRRVILTDNRHVEPGDIAAVFLAWLLPAFAATPVLRRPLLLTTCSIAYLAARAPLLLGAYAPAGLPMLARAIPLTYALDIIRGAAVLGGTGRYALEALTQGRVSPFHHKKPRRTRT